MHHTRVHIGQKRNQLLRYRLVMQEVDKHDLRDISIVKLHKRYIYPKFAISRDTLYRIFNTDIEAELKKCEERLAQLEAADTQLTMF